MLLICVNILKGIDFVDDDSFLKGAINIVIFNSVGNCILVHYILLLNLYLRIFIFLKLFNKVND